MPSSNNFVHLNRIITLGKKPSFKEIIELKPASTWPHEKLQFNSGKKTDNDGVEMKTNSNLKY